MRKLVLAASCLLTASAFAHVPYLENRDFTEQKPFAITDAVENSKAVYAWFATGNDVDVYTFSLTAPTRVFAQAIVPVCPGYENLLPWFAIVGPGLPAPTQPLPFTVPAGSGVVVTENSLPGEPRDTFYESVGGKDYYDGPTFDEVLSQAGNYKIYYWDPYQQGGDYAAVIGYLEVFSPSDLSRSAALTPYIRADKELHVACP